MGLQREAEGFFILCLLAGRDGRAVRLQQTWGNDLLVREVSDIPCAIGFGISTPEQAADMAARAGRGDCGQRDRKACGGARKGVRPVCFTVCKRNGGCGT